MAYGLLCREAPFLDLKQLIFRPLHLLMVGLCRLLPPSDDDAWRVVDVRVPFKRFGRGSLNRFSWYFEGASAVPVATVDDICRWLRSCTYATDKELFNEDDFWQHPRTFEILRRGDCEDHAIWAWRKLNKLGIDARLVVGRWLRGDQDHAGGHAWVVFELRGDRWLLESVVKGTNQMVWPLHEIQDEYQPHFSVDGGYRTRAYGGFIRYTYG